MNPLSWIGDLIVKPIAGVVQTYTKGKAEIKVAKVAAEVARYTAKAERYKTDKAAETDWDMAALKQSQHSWKDEFIMLIWFTPFIMLFIPIESVQSAALAGFAALAKVPYGYWLVLFGIVAQAFGLRWLISNKTDKAIKTIKEGVQS